LPELSSLAGETVLIVGSGLTSGHLAVGAVKRGAKVVMMARRTFQEKVFDAEPGWLGPKYLKGFHAEPDMQARWQMVQQARNGGSLTPAVMMRLRQLQRQGQITFYEHCQVADAQWKGDAWKVCCDNHSVHDCIAHQPIHRIWLATGTPWISDLILCWQTFGSATPSKPSTACPYWMKICAGRGVNCF
jgi:hypothetical protein